MNNTRTYDSIKLVRGKRRNDELNRLADEQQDFDFRKLFIEENELDLQVLFSRRVFSRWLSCSFLAFTLFFLPHIVTTIILFGLAVLTRIISYIYKRKFENRFRCYSFSLRVVDYVILKDHDISVK